MRILLISYSFHPEPGALFGLPFARELARRGHEVQALTSFPNLPGGKVYDGYRIQPLFRETIEGISIVRVPLYPSHDRSAARRILSYSSFAASAATIGALAVRKADVAYICQGPATLGVPGGVIRLLRGIPFVYNIVDLWPDTLAASGMFLSPMGLRMVAAWCKVAYRLASKIVVVTPGFKERLLARGVPERKIDVVYNWCDDSEIRPLPRDPVLSERLGMTGRFNVVFAGNLGAAQALHAVLDAAAILRESCPSVQFVLVGGGVEAESLRQRASDRGLSNVRFLSHRSQAEVASILALGDVLLVHLRDEPLFRITIPSKTQAYMAAGRPILIGVRGEAADLVTRAKAGLTCEPENPREIVQAIERMQAMPSAELDALGENGRQFYQRELSLAAAAARYEEIFADVARRC